MEELINNVDVIVLSFVQGSFGNLTGPVQALWRLMFIVFVAVYGYKIMISGRFSATDLVTHCVKIIVVLCLATQWDMFFLFIFNMVTDMPADIAGHMLQAASSSFGATAQAGNTANSANTALSQFFDRSMAASSNLLQGARWSDFGHYIYAFAIWCGALGVTGYAAMLIILAKLAVAILLAIGPLFILLLIFADTRSLFEGWLRTLLNYALIPIFVYAMLAILLTLAEAPLRHLENTANGFEAIISVVGPFLLICVIAVLLLAQILHMVASVTGGVSLSTMGIARLVGRNTVTGPGSKAFVGARNWSWQKTTPARAYVGGKIKAGVSHTVKAGHTVLKNALKRTREVR